ncbi:hypothetical protein KUCAC02_030114, partial [Chaenocephalus aceratus]
RPLFRCTRPSESHKAVKRAESSPFLFVSSKCNPLQKHNVSNVGLPAVEPVLASIALDHKL